MASTPYAFPAFLLLLTTVFGASAQTRPANVAPVIDGAPVPPLRVKSGEALDPEVRTIRQEHGSIAEYRVNGHLRAIRIESDGFPAYWLIDANGDGQLDPGGDGRLDGRAGDPDPAGEMMPRWVIFNW